MKISGFTIIKNAIINDYPVVESIESVLPVVDEMIVLVGDCEDDTENLIRSIASDKIKIYRSVWNPELRKGGAALADETNKAFALIDPDADWAFYIQADEVIHEDDYPAILKACDAYKDNKKVEGLLFKYVHFYGTYDYVGDSRKWYDHEIRIIRNNKQVQSFRDAQGFRMNGEQKLKVKHANASIYHYGWVKSPQQMKKKQTEAARYWHEDDELEAMNTMETSLDFSQFDSLAKFTGTHPKVMAERIRRKNWALKLDISKKKFSFKERVLYLIEKNLGLRLFDFKNYNILRN